MKHQGNRFSATRSISASVSGLRPLSALVLQLIFFQNLRFSSATNKISSYDIFVLMHNQVCFIEELDFYVHFAIGHKIKIGNSIGYIHSLYMQIRKNR